MERGFTAFRKVRRTRSRLERKGEESHSVSNTAAASEGNMLQVVRGPNCRRVGGRSVSASPGTMDRWEVKVSISLSPS